MSLREGVNASRRFHFWLTADLEAQVSVFAHHHGLGLGQAIRSLLAERLSEPTRSTQDSTATLAVLVAAEQAILMVASILPEGERRMRELGPRAAVAAEERLATFMAAAAESSR